MPEVYRQGLELIRAIQRVEGPALTLIMTFLTNTVYIYTPIILFLLWCGDEKKGFHLGLMMMFSAWLNGFCKELLKQPRPYHLDPSVGRGVEATFGLPSGHAQLSLTFWMILACWLGRRFPRGRVGWFGGAILISLSVGFSRVYLGLHFFTDIIAGWLLGGLITAGYFLSKDRLEAFFRWGGTRVQLICGAVIPWAMNAAGGDRRVGGLCLGFSLGFSLMLKYFPFSAGGTINGGKPGFLRLAGRYALGIIGGFIILNLTPLNKSAPFYELIRFICWGAAGLWASAGCPLLFLRLNLAENRKDRGR
ncbi:MAG: phosphatase PAP2 family protein [Spirochaetaceae bacterium]|jgi:membrane-associated phospholipid phosphatase|nr:phosphatase PAP2 family protein [Spirochaetaceae bacterium]